ncbi:hypothetical protein E4U54_001689 [Claviceps lovelessii]|nr:hypothetical protein E4U54_001689 [Claviceps lovelessii]
MGVEESFLGRGREKICRQQEIFRVTGSANPNEGDEVLPNVARSAAAIVDRKSRPDDWSRSVRLIGWWGRPSNSIHVKNIDGWLLNKVYSLPAIEIHRGVEDENVAGSKRSVLNGPAKAGGLDGARRGVDWRSFGFYPEYRVLDITVAEAEARSCWRLTGDVKGEELDEFNNKVVAASGGLMKLSGGRKVRTDYCPVSDVVYD